MKMRTSTFFVLVITVFSYILYVSVFDIEYGQNENRIIWLLSVLGIALYIFVLWTWKQLYGSFYSLYTIFMTFAFAFTYGQCFMWAIGVHSDSEIGATILYSTKIGIASKHDIICTQIMTLMGLLAFHCGAVLSYKKKSMKLATETQDDDAHFETDRKNLYLVSKVAALFSFPAAIYNSIKLLIVYRTYGYGANLYNKDVISSTNNVVILISMMFFASLVGLIIGSNYKKRIVIFCYSVFAVYAVICAIGGDRGEWLYPLVFLVWLHIQHYGKLNIRRFLKYVPVGVLLIVILSAISNARKHGVTVESLSSSLSTSGNPISSTFFEMGKQMIIPLIFIQEGWDIYPYGNTYVFAVLGMVTERVITGIINPQYVSVGGWLSQEYLGIDYGAGFSMIGEALVNFGPYFCIIALLFLGMIYSRVMNTQNIDCKKDSIGLFFKVTTAEVIISSIRNPMITSLKNWFFSTVIMLLAVRIIKSLRKG